VVGVPAEADFSDLEQAELMAEKRHTTMREKKFSRHHAVALAATWIPGVSCMR
jgi:hypothetical protein